MNSFTYIGNRSKHAEMAEEITVTIRAPGVPAGLHGTAWFPLQQVNR